MTDHLDDLISEANQILDDALVDHVTAAGRSVAAICILFSGGNDSTVLAHMFKARADYAVHANTGIGVEQTREFVRATCTSWGLPLLEEHPPPGSTYRELVLDQGFPGPGMHWKMYQRLKERALRQVQRYVVTNSRKQRVIFLAGRRRSSDLN
jgi:3'-phosphoadenosine 5'-phosphosulfate sulfotransferase (PAPS reductase)/FAD synthetase